MFQTPTHTYTSLITSMHRPLCSHSSRFAHCTDCVITEQRFALTNKRKRLISVSTSVLSKSESHPHPLTRICWSRTVIEIEERAEGNYAAPGHRASHFPHKRAHSKCEKQLIEWGRFPSCCDFGCHAAHGKVRVCRLRGEKFVVASETQQRR